ncbi:tRNA1(Val) (adenine(37)-N6)-methyltransferase [Polyangium mundeleinium]|uniref:Methyltransferase n=1 Tax=Polyangium mundeleinium TaxID=2995306 RepID=A0ABT5EIV0_9BACT|nr:methyltransferase [Polyangium mundeleinium]MDC0741284.1 methyltransferase [Polyangium mundeleinium]
MLPASAPDQLAATKGAGIVRPARRPAGWVAPGPQPRTPDREDVWPGPGEDLCYLAGDFRILQRVDGHRWSADDLVTAWYAIEQLRHAPPRRAVDLGCGIGTVLLFVTWAFQEARVTGVEAQDVSAGLARRSLAWNGVDDRCAVRFGDLRDPLTTEGLEGAELVTGTPPYLPKGTGIESSKVQCGPCRFEWRGGVEDYALAAARLLAEDAPFVGCAASRQRPRVEAAAVGAGLVLERYRDVIPREGKDPLFSVYVMRRPAAARAPEIEPPLVLRGKDGRFTAAFDEVRRAMGMPVER